jgi:hypothetical protein
MIDIYDIEVYPNLFMYCGLNKDKPEEKTKFIFHESVDSFNNDFPFNFYEYHNKILKGQIGFNNINYDSQVIQYILNNESNFKNLTTNEITEKIYNYSQKIINSNSSFPEIPEWKIKVPQLDLFKIWHFDNKNKSTSLKWVEYSIDWYNIQELPLPHNSIIKKEQLSLIEEYCWNDVLVTLEFYNITKGQTNHPLYKDINKISLREDISNEFNINCFNYNDVKIGDEINKINYLKNKNITKEELYKLKSKNVISKKEISFKECIPEYVKFKTLPFQNFYKLIKNEKIKLNET